MRTAIGIAAALVGASVVFAQAEAPAAPPPPAPAKKRPAAAKPKPAPAPSYKDLKFPPLGDVKIPDIPAFTLPNGMRVYLLENRELPLVSGLALVRTGNLFEPAEKVGLAGLTGSVMRTGGTKEKTGDQIDEELENIAASVESGIGETSGSVSFSCLKENTDQVLAILKGILTAPEFRQDKLDLAKTQTRSSISRRNDDAEGIASREFSDVIYGPQTPFGRRMEYEHLDRIAREDLIAFHRRYFFPANTIFAVQGDFDSASMRARIEKLFADWTVKQEPVPQFPDVTAKPVHAVLLAEKPDVTQTFFRIGHLGGLLRDKDFAALSVAADILGGGFSSRLFRKVRTELGYAYGIGAGWGAGYLHPGIFQISGSTKSANTLDTLKTVHAELERMRTSEVTTEELDTARNRVLNSFVFNFDRPSKTLNRLLTYEYYGYPKDFIFQYQKAVASVTKADVLRAAKQHFRPEDFTIVAVGNPKDFGKPLSELGIPVKAIDLTIPEPKQDKPKTDAASLQKGLELLKRVQQAMGGVEKLSAVKDYSVSASVAINTGGGTMQAKQRNRWIAPSTFRQDQELPFGRISVFYDGKAGWFAGPQGVQPLPAPAVKQIEIELSRLLFRLVAANEANLTAPNTLIVGNFTLEVDPKTFLPARLSYQGMGMTGAPTKVSETYSDWRDVSGIKLPGAISIEQGGQKFADSKLTEIVINGGLKAEELAQKP